MNNILKKIIFVVVFVFCTLALPAMILLVTVDGTEGFSVYVTVYGVILFGIFGYVVVSVRSVSKEIHDALEEMKKQNAAIAYKLTHFDENIDIDDKEAKTNKSENASSDQSNADAEEKVPVEKVNLNPADPLDFD